MIHAERLTVEFSRRGRSKLRALDDVTFEIPRGEFFALLGENGAGKSTAMHCFLGLLRPTSGSVRINGVPPILGSAVFERVAYLPEEPHYPDYLTVEEAVDYYSDLYRRPIARERRLAILERLGLGRFRDLKLAKCSKGMKQKVGIAQSLINEPELMFLDEPMRGLDPAGVHDFRDVLVEMNRNGTTIVMNSHILAEVEAVASRVGILHAGRLVALGDIESLTRSAEDVYDVSFEADEVPAVVYDVAKEDGMWRGSVAAARLADLVAEISGGKGRLVRCELKRMSLEDRFLAIIREERAHA